MLLNAFCNLVFFKTVKYFYILKLEEDTLCTHTHIHINRIIIYIRYFADRNNIIYV